MGHMRSKDLNRQWDPKTLGGCVLHLPFYQYDKAQTIIYDQSGQGNHGTITGATPAFVGSESIGWNFDGVDDYVSCGTGASLNIGNNMSLLLWMRIESYPSGYTYYASKDAGGGWGLISNSDRIDFYANTDTAWSLISEDVDGIPLSKWSCVSVTIPASGQLAKMYENGVMVNYSAIGTIGIGTASPLNIGTTQTPDQFGKMRTGEVLVFNRALSPQEIKAYYDNTRAIYGI